MNLETQQIEEIKFWKNLAEEKGENYEQHRKGDYHAETKNFPHFKSQDGFGLDLGCGLISVLEFSGKSFIAIDPLLDEYDKIVPVFKRMVAYEKQFDPDTIPFRDENFDWVFCVNVVDHTKDPKRLMREIFRVLKPGGKLYFEVNFDDHLLAPHYELWDNEKINALKQMNIFKTDFEFVERVDKDQQSRYWAEMIKI
ncbi:MAG: class I SAM-dependent methyltransferase [Patescibacteria group bacterium]|nr:class I SAM-dependent methyltransferase [Patescibacteria group bacterium]